MLTNPDWRDRFAALNDAGAESPHAVVCTDANES